MKRPYGQFHFLHVFHFGNTSPLRIPALDEPRVDRHPLALDHDVVFASGNQDVFVAVGQAAFDQLMRASVPPCFPGYVSPDRFGRALAGPDVACRFPRP